MCDKPVATFWGWMPNGVKTNIPVPLDGTPEDFDRVLNYQNMFLARGFVLEDPAFGKLDAGEKREQVGYVLRREKDDGSTVLDLYPASDRTSFRFVMCYLDNAEDIAAFEGATGLVLKNIPLYEGDRMERGNNEKSNRYIVKVQQSAHAVIKDNPNYNPTETDVKKKKPARIFIRWDSVVATTQAPPPPPAVPQAAESAKAAPPATPEPSRVAELRNEELTITRIEPRSDSSGWYGYGMFDDGVGQHETRVNLFAPEDPNAITEAGYKWVTSGKVEWPVTLRIDRNMTRIDKVLPKVSPEPLETPPSANAGQSTDPTWYGNKVNACWGAVKMYLLTNVYANNSFAMKGSLHKRSISADKEATLPSGDWANRTAGDLIHMLETRHDEPLAEAS